ncbi:mCG1036884, partial [Mus musculus]
PKTKANGVGERGNSGDFSEPGSEGSRRFLEVPVQAGSISTVSPWLSLPACSTYSLKGKFPPIVPAPHE